MKKNKFYLIMLISVVFIFTTNSSFSLFEKPYNTECAGLNMRIDHGTTTKINGSWELQNIRFHSDKTIDWANYRCYGGGNECREGDWATIWSPSSIHSDWPIGPDGNPEPPLPNEPGLWLKLYFTTFPTNYDPTTDQYLP